MREAQNYKKALVNQTFISFVSIAMDTEGKKQQHERLRDQSQAKWLKWQNPN